MKHKLVIIVCLAVIAGLGLYAKQIHHQYQVKEAHAAAVAQSAKLNAQREASQKAAQFRATVLQNETWCAHDKIGYAVLTPAAKLKTEAPICDDSLVE